MVDIIPYIDDDDEDESNWVPLTTASSPVDGGSNGNDTPATAAAVDVDDASNGSIAGKNVVNSDAHKTCGTSRITGPDDTKVSPHEDIVFVENVDDGDDGWQELSSRASPPPQQQLTATTNSARDATDPPWSLGKQLIAHLTSTTTVTTATATSTSGLEDEGAESDSEENNVVWRRADDLDDNYRDVDGIYENNTHLGGIDQEYDDDKLLAMRFPSREEGGEPLHRPEPRVNAQHDSESRRQDQQPNDYEPHWQKVHNQHEQKQHTNHQFQEQQHSCPSSTVKTKLRQKLIHDPLRALPTCFLRHLYHETKNEIVSMWETYFEQHELHNILAPLVLIGIFALLGVVLVGKGLIGISSIIAHTFFQAVVSFCTWMVTYAWMMTYQLAWISTCILFALGTVVWIFWWKIDAVDNTLKPPAISTLLPWVLAFTSTSFYEAIILILSLRPILSVIFPAREILHECVLLSGDAGENNICLAEDKNYIQESGAIPACVLVILVATINGIVVSTAAKMLEPRDDQNQESLKGSSNFGPNPAGSWSDSLFLGNLHKCYTEIQKHTRICHTISIFSLAALSVAVVILQTLYAYCLEEGRGFIFTLADRIGTVGCNIACIGLGIFVLITMWNVAIAAFAGNNENAMLDGGISCGDLARNALKKSIVEISSNAVWTGDDVGSSLLGVLSDDDGALRFAILEWVIDHWVTSSSTSSHTTSSQSSDAPSSAATNGSNENDSAHGSRTDPNDTSSHHHHFPGHAESTHSNSNTNTSKSTSSDNPHTLLPPYQSLQDIIAKLDADETLIPTIERYRAWVYSLPPSQNAAMYLALWKMCPAVAVLILASVLCAAKYVIIKSFLCLSWHLGAPSPQIVVGDFLFIGAIVIIMLPCLFLEYHRVSKWRARTMGRMKDMKYNVNNDQVQSDLIILLMQADSVEDDITSDKQTSIEIHVFLVDTSFFVHRSWLLLLESISVLESSIPVVRCATVACAAADLTSDTICLVDMALEVKKRGLVGGVGMMLWDAFFYHLSLELKERRRQNVTDSNGGDDFQSSSPDAPEETHDEGLDGQYTGAVVSAVENLGRMSHNITCLMSNQQKDHCQKGSDSNVSDNTSEEEIEPHSEKEEAESTLTEEVEEDQETSGNLFVASPMNGCSPTDSTKSEPVSTPAQAPVNDSPGHYISYQEGKEDDLLQKKSSTENDDNAGMIPFLIGGGLALAGAVAGIAVHTANSNGQAEGKSQKKGNPSKESS